MKSPKLVSSLSPTGACSEIGCWAILSTARTRSTGICISSAISSGVGSRPNSWRRRFWARMSLLIVSIMWTGNADGAGLVGDGAGDGLANPPGGVGGEFVAALVFEFFDRLSSGPCCLPGSGRERRGRGWCISWRWRSPGAGWPRPFRSWPHRRGVAAFFMALWSARNCSRGMRTNFSSAASLRVRRPIGRSLEADLRARQLLDGTKSGLDLVVDIFGDEMISSATLGCKRILENRPGGFLESLITSGSARGGGLAAGRAALPRKLSRASGPGRGRV